MILLNMQDTKIRRPFGITHGPIRSNSIGRSPKQTPCPPSAAFLTNPLGLSEQRLEELAKEGTSDALTQLTMVAQALQESLREYERQGKDGRNVVVKQFRARLARVTSLMARCQNAA